MRARERISRARPLFTQNRLTAHGFCAGPGLRLGEVRSDICSTYHILAMLVFRYHGKVSPSYQRS